MIAVITITIVIPVINLIIITNENKPKNQTNKLKNDKKQRDDKTTRDISHRTMKITKTLIACGQQLALAMLK